MSTLDISSRIADLDSEINSLKAKIEDARGRGDKEEAHDLRQSMNALISERTQLWALLGQQQAAQQAQPPAVRESPRYPKSVYIFGEMEGEDILHPCGTCFVISPRHLLTAQHNMVCKKATKRPSWITENYAIALTVSKTNGIQGVAKDLRRVRVKYFNSGMDWAILELVGAPFSEDTPPIPITTMEVEQDTDFKVFHMPICDYVFEESDTISAFTVWGKTAVPTNHHVQGSIGLYAGSSGAPFVLRSGHAFAMHLESRNESKQIPAQTTDIEVISNTINSNGSVHASRCSGLYFKSCNELLARLRVLNIPYQS